MIHSFFGAFLEAAWPLIAAGFVGLALLAFYRCSPLGRTIRSTVVFFLPGILLVSMSVIGCLILCERISLLWGNYQQSIQEQLVQRSDELIDLLMTGRYVELNSTLARIREAASLGDLTIRGMDEHLLARSSARTRGDSSSIFSIPLVRNDIDGSAVRWGVLTYQTDPSQMQAWISTQRKRWTYVSGLVVLIVSLFSVFSSHLIGRLFNGLHSSLVDLQERIASARSPQDLALVLSAQGRRKSELMEETILLSSFKNIGGQLSKLHKTTADLEAEARFGRTIAQVVHDIRSPLSLIQAVIKKESDSKNESALLLKMGCDRIKSITSDLLTQYRNRDAQFKNRLVRKSPFALLIERIVLEKRIIFEQSQIGLALTIDENAWCDFVMIEAKELGRALSNIIGNAFEASKPGLVIAINVQSTETSAQVVIQDQGCGMSDATMRRFGERGFTVSKVGGNGLGAYHAKTLIENAGGRFEVHSTVGKGTRIRISLPKASQPGSYYDLSGSTSGKTFLLTQDASFASVFKAVLPGELSRWFQSNEDIEGAVGRDPSAQVMIDVDSWSPSELTSILSALKTSKPLVLITDNVWDPLFEQVAIGKELQLLPKAWLLRRPIVKAAEPVDLILIDDDPLIHMTWEMRSKDLNKKIMTFDSLQAFNTVDVSKDTPVYIDLHLKEQYSGLQIAEELYARGFYNLHIATGDTSFDQRPHHVSSISGKDFPFEA